MVSTILILALAILCLVLAWSLLSRKKQLPRPRECQQKQLEVDIRILRSLLDLNDVHYLHSTLSHQDFQNQLRMRIRLTLQMLRLVEQNLLSGVEQVATSNSSSELKRRQDDLLAGTVRLQLNLLLAKLFLSLQWLFPSWTLFLPEWVQPYRPLLDNLRA